MRTRTSAFAWVAASWGLLAMGGCAGGAPVPPERAAAVQRQFLQPFLDGGEIGCGELLVETTANFVNNVSQPAVDPKRHGARKEQGDGFVDTIWINKIGDMAGAFVVAIGETSDFTDEGKFELGKHTTFTVLHQVRIRVFEGTHPMTLAIEAKGPPLVRHLGTVVQDLRTFRVDNGVLQQQ